MNEWTTAVKMVTDDILGKTPVSLPNTTGYSLPPTWDRFRQKKRQSNREWQGKTARACIGSHTFLIDGSWLLPTKRLFRSAANFDFHDNRPKMADLKSVYRSLSSISCWVSFGDSSRYRHDGRSWWRHHRCGLTKIGCCLSQRQGAYASDRQGLGLRS